MDNKTKWTVLGTVSGIALLSVGAVLLWNSKQLRLARAYKRAGRILYSVGTALRNVSGVAEEMM
jgi:hypothetical protein